MHPYRAIQQLHTDCTFSCYRDRTTSLIQMSIWQLAQEEGLFSLLGTICETDPGCQQGHQAPRPWPRARVHCRALTFISTF